MRFIPNFKGYDFFPHNTRIDFMRFKNFCFGLSVALIVLTFVLLGVRGLNFGVDFKGGSMIEVQSTAGPVNVAELRQILSTLELGEVQLQEFGGSSDVLIRLEQQPGGEEAQQVALKKVLTALGDGYIQRRTEVVGPAVSSELRMSGTLAVIASLIAICLYVWFRFEWQFAVGTIVALLHDVLVVVGIFSLFQLPFDLATVAALLTILGYSVNDTIVISDRIRENLRKYKRMELAELLNLSINETLSRTILTGITTLAVLVALYFLGGEVIRYFTLAMLLGVVIGAYSSVFVAAPMIDYFSVKRDWAGTDAAKKSPTVASKA